MVIFFRITINQTLFYEFILNGTTTTLQSHMKDRNMDVALVLGSNLDLYDVFRITLPISDMSCHWILPKRTMSFLGIVHLHQDILLYYSLLHFLVFLTFWLISVYNKHRRVSLRNTWFIIVRMCLFQSLNTFPRFSWFPYFLLFYIALATNLNITLQSYLKSLIMVPHIDKSLTNLYELVHSDTPLIYQRSWMKSLVTSLDDESIKILKRKTTFVNISSVSSQYMLANKESAILVTDLIGSRIQNWKYLLKLRQVFIVLRITNCVSQFIFLEKRIITTRLHRAEGTSID